MTHFPIYQSCDSAGKPLVTAFDDRTRAPLIGHVLAPDGAELVDTCGAVRLYVPGLSGTTNYMTSLQTIDQARLGYYGLAWKPVETPDA